MHVWRHDPAAHNVGLDEILRNGDSVPLDKDAPLLEGATEKLEELGASFGNIHVLANPEKQKFFSHFNEKGRTVYHHGYTFDQNKSTAMKDLPASHIIVFSGEDTRQVASREAFLGGLNHTRASHDPVTRVIKDGALNEQYYGLFQKYFLTKYPELLPYHNSYQEHAGNPYWRITDYPTADLPRNIVEVIAQSEPSIDPDDITSVRGERLTYEVERRVQGWKGHYTEQLQTLGTIALVFTSQGVGITMIGLFGGQKFPPQAHIEGHEIRNGQRIGFNYGINARHEHECS